MLKSTLTSSRTSLTISMLSGWEFKLMLKPLLIQFAPLPVAGILIGSRIAKIKSNNTPTQRPMVSMKKPRSLLPTKKLHLQASTLTGTHGPALPTNLSLTRIESPIASPRSWISSTRNEYHEDELMK